MEVVEISKIGFIMCLCLCDADGHAGRSVIQGFIVDHDLIWFGV